MNYRGMERRGRWCAQTRDERAASASSENDCEKSPKVYLSHENIHRLNKNSVSGSCCWCWCFSGLLNEVQSGVQQQVR